MTMYSNYPVLGYHKQPNF